MIQLPTNLVLSYRSCTDMMQVHISAISTSTLVPMGGGSELLSTKARLGGM